MQLLKFAAIPAFRVLLFAVPALLLSACILQSVALVRWRRAANLAIKQVEDAAARCESLRASLAEVTAALNNQLKK